MWWDHMLIGRSPTSGDMIMGSWAKVLAPPSLQIFGNKHLRVPVPCVLHFIISKVKSCYCSSWGNLRYTAFCCWWVSNRSHSWQRIFCIKLTHPRLFLSPSQFGTVPASDHPGNPNPTRFQPTVDPSKCLGIPGDWWQSEWWLWVGVRNILLDMYGILNAISPKTAGLLKIDANDFFRTGSLGTSNL